MTDGWLSIEHLPAAYSSVASGMVAANRVRVREGLASGQWFPLVRRVNMNTHLWLSTESQKVMFFFFPGKPKRDVLLRLEVSMRLCVGQGVESPVVPPFLPVAVVLPRFMGPVQDEDKQVLARRLGSGVDEVLFLRAGNFRFGALGVEEPKRARAAWMLAGQDEARMVYPLPGPAGRTVFDPEPFLMLMDRVEDWVRARFDSTLVYAAPPPVPASPLAVQRIAALMIEAWRQTARVAAGPAVPQGPADVFNPPLILEKFETRVTLRLTPEGAVAEKPQEDTFRMSFEGGVEQGEHGAEVRFRIGPADFLIDGDLHAKLTGMMSSAKNARRIFDQVRLPGEDESRFGTFLGTGAAEAAVFRIRKDGDNDTDMFVYRGDWKGVADETLIVAAEFLVTMDGETAHVEQKSDARLIFSNLGTQTEAQPELPEYLFRLLGQLRNWRRALQ